MTLKSPGRIELFALVSIAIITIGIVTMIQGGPYIGPVTITGSSKDLPDPEAAFEKIRDLAGDIGMLDLPADVGDLYNPKIEAVDDDLIGVEDIGVLTSEQVEQIELRKLFVPEEATAFDTLVEELTRKIKELIADHPEYESKVPENAIRVEYIRNLLKYTLIEIANRIAAFEALLSKLDSEKGISKKSPLREAL